MKPTDDDHDTYEDYLARQEDHEDEYPHDIEILKKAIIGLTSEKYAALAECDRCNEAMKEYADWLASNEWDCMLNTFRQIARKHGLEVE